MSAARCPNTTVTAASSACNNGCKTCSITVCGPNGRRAFRRPMRRDSPAASTTPTTRIRLPSRAPRPGWPRRSSHNPYSGRGCPRCSAESPPQSGADCCPRAARFPRFRTTRAYAKSGRCALRGCGHLACGRICQHDTLVAADRGSPHPLIAGLIWMIRDQQSNALDLRRSGEVMMFHHSTVPQVWCQKHLPYGSYHEFLKWMPQLASTRQSSM